MTKEELISAIEAMTVLELNELVKTIEEKFGVSSLTAPAAPTAGVAEATAPAEEKTIFDVELTAAGTNKISAIKAVREINNTLGLAEAKALVDGAPKIVAEGLKKEAAQEARKKLEAAGAKVTLK